MRSSSEIFQLSKVVRNVVATGLSPKPVLPDACGAALEASDLSPLPNPLSSATAGETLKHTRLAITRRLMMFDFEGRFDFKRAPLLCVI